MKKNLVIACLTVMFIFPSCTKNKDYTEQRLVIAEVGTSKLYDKDFIAAYEVTKLGYPHNEIIHGSRNLKEEVLTQIIEEQLILNEAEKRGMQYTEEEFQKDIVNVKKEYPDNVFEELLKKNAIDLLLWEVRFRREKAIDKSLNEIIKDKVEVSAEDLKIGFFEYCRQNSLNPEEIQNDPEVSSLILGRVKRRKSEESYDSLLEKLQKNTTINVNKKNWEEILKSTKY